MADLTGLVGALRQSAEFLHRKGGDSRAVLVAAEVVDSLARDEAELNRCRAALAAISLREQGLGRDDPLTILGDIFEIARAAVKR